jgi:hypothetical protein
MAARNQQPDPTTPCRLAAKKIERKKSEENNRWWWLNSSDISD